MQRSPQRVGMGRGLAGDGDAGRGEQGRHGRGVASDRCQVEGGGPVLLLLLASASFLECG